MSTRFGINGLDSRAHQTGHLSVSAPVTHGFTQFDLEIHNGVVVKAKPILGSMHRGVEKLFESRDYRQILMLANRHEWLGAFAGEVGVAQLLEDALGIEVPESADWFRTLLMEYTRVTSHLAFIAPFITQVELNLEREKWIQHISKYTGNRMHPMVTRIGGLTHAPTAQWVSEISELVTRLQTAFESVGEFTPYSGIGVLSSEDAISFAVSGPVARASGYQIDLRTNALKYSELDFAVIARDGGDVNSRVNQLIAEVKQSLALLSQLIPICVGKVDNDVNVLLPKVIRVPQGTYAHDIETPLGIASWLLVSQNDKMPYRLKLRPASLHTLLATEKVLENVSVNDLDVAIASMPFISGDTDR